MKKIYILLIMILCFNINISFATQVDEEYDQDIMEEVKQSLRYKVSTSRLFSKWGWSQADVIAQYLNQNNGFKKKLNASSILEAATVEKIEYGHIIGVCSIDYKALDKYVVDNTLQDNIDKVIKILDEYYVEIKCEGVTLAYMSINDNERISHFIEPGIFESDYISSILPTDLYLTPTIYLIKDNDYIQGIYTKSNIITYTDFDNSTNNSQFVSYSVNDILMQADEKYIIDNPRIDYELLEQQKNQEIQQLIEEGKQRDIILYTMAGVLLIILVLVIVIFIKIMKKV